MIIHDLHMHIAQMRTSHAHCLGSEMFLHQPPEPRHDVARIGARGQWSLKWKWVKWIQMGHRWSYKIY